VAADDPIRELLTLLPRNDSIPTNQGAVAILYEHVEQATDDVGAVEQWITDHGGRKQSDPLHDPPPLKAGRGFKDQHRTYFLVPLDALEK
jgi:hypothetical protein